MSIFKETIDKTIQTQLKARTLVVSGKNNNRSQYLPWYLSKNSWVRMTSFVNFNSGKIGSDGKGKFTIIKDGNYSEEQLSKKYILEGGTLYTRNNTTEGALRYNIAEPGAAYGGNIDLFGKSADEYFRTFGIRPMPGITGVNLRTIGAYGSLFETTIQFHAWDNHQLNELEILFMRPGYSVLLEWGWSQYIDYSDNNTELGNDLTDIYPTVFNGGTINPFELQTDLEIYAKLETLRKKYRHNYDGMLGYVKNFSWKMNKNGGFDCTTTLISMGEVINTLKMSTNANNLGKSATNNTNFEASSYVYDDYENILLSLKADIDVTTKYYYLKNKKVIDEDQYRQGFDKETNQYMGGWNYDYNYIPKADILSKIGNSQKYQRNPFFQQLEYSKEQGDKYEYISLDFFISLINSYINLKAEGAKGIYYPVKIKIPDNNSVCLASKDTISVDPRICQVKNYGAFKNEFQFLEYEGDLKPGEQGIDPPFYYMEDGSRKIIGGNEYNFYDPLRKVGYIKNIFLNINMLLSLYKSMKSSSNEEGVIMNDYVKKVLSEVSNALGGLNNFTISTAGRDQNTWQIVDLYYLEDPDKTHKENKYEFDLMGLGSICRDVDIQSQIFQEQSTIVAIAAQSRANLGDVYNSSQVYLNAGLEDRIAKAKGQGVELTSEPQGNKNDVLYAKLLNLMIYARDYIVGVLDKESASTNIYKIFPNLDGDGNSSLLKQFLLKFDADLNFKALIPFKLKITIDGIGGIVVGQIFRVKQNILPKNYYDKNLGFIVTKIEHNLQNNDWTTTLETQICILDQDKPLFQQFIDIERKGFGKFVEKLQIRGILYPILIDFIEYQAARSVIGFALAGASNEGTFSDTEGANEVFYDWVYGGNFDSTFVKTYWEDNIDFFLLNTGNNFDIYTLDNFGLFVQAWAKTRLELYGRAAEVTSFSETKTEKDVFTWLSNESWLANNNDPEYQELAIQIQEIQQTLTANKDIFYPKSKNLSPSSLYANDEGKLSVDELFNRRLGSESSNEGFNRAEIRKRIDRFIDRNPSTATVKNYYYAPLVFPTGGTLASRYRAQNDGTEIVYGNQKSIVHPYGDTPYTLLIPDKTHNYSESQVKDITKRFSNTIAWDSVYNGRTVNVRNTNNLIASLAVKNKYDSDWFYKVYSRFIGTQ